MGTVNSASGDIVTLSSLLADTVKLFSQPHAKTYECSTGKEFIWSSHESVNISVSLTSPPLNIFTLAWEG